MPKTNAQKEDVKAILSAQAAVATTMVLSMASTHSHNMFWSGDCASRPLRPAPPPFQELPESFLTCSLCIAYVIFE